jgi:hypothetical protein
LVRATSLDPAGPEATEFARSGNISPTQEEVPARQGASLNYLIDDSLLSNLDIPPDATLGDVLSKSNHPILREIRENIPLAKRSAYFTSDNRLTDGGKELVTEMLLSKFLPVETLERMGAEHRSLKNAIEGVVPQMIGMKGRADIAPHINEAINHMLRFPEDKTPGMVDQTLSQRNMLEGEQAKLSPAGQMMLDFILTSKDQTGAVNSKRVREGLTRLSKAMSERTKTLLGAPETTELEDAASALGVQSREGAAFANPRAVRMSLRYHRATRSLYTQLAAAYYGGKVGNCLA